MRIGALVQARVSSQRLPGKVVHRVGGKPLLEYLLERLRRVSPLEALVVATSAEPGDDAVAGLCRDLGVDCHRGALDDVAGRFLGAATEHRLDAFVRVSGDSPLLDPHLVDQAVAQFRAAAADVVTNVFPRSFPPGQSVEVVAVAALAAALSTMSVEEKEHVTLHFYRHADRFRVANFSADPPADGDLHMAVDTAADLEAFGAVLGQMDGPHWEYGWRELAGLYRAAVRR